MVVAHHAGQAYGNTGGVWLVDDINKSSFFRPWFFINAAYMMGLYFFISGYFMMFSLRRKTNLEFLSDRLKRLGIPLIFFTFFIFTPLNFLLSKSTATYFEFFIELYFKMPPLATGHLWFVASLLAYTIIYIIIRKLRIGNSLIYIRFSFFHPLLYVFFISLINYTVRLFYSIDVWKTWLIPVEVAHLPQYFSMFILGILFFKNNWLDRIDMKMSMFYGALAVLFWLVLNMFNKNSLLLESFSESFMCVGVSLALIGIFKKYANTSNQNLALLSENTYGIYLFHLLIVLAFQNLIANIYLTPFFKFVIVTLLSILSSLLISILLRRINLIKSII
jgi:surface polysaccharide O-acyltransferase-like enzyme